MTENGSHQLIVRRDSTLSRLMKTSCLSVKGTSFMSLELKKEAGGKAH